MKRAGRQQVWRSEAEWRELIECYKSSGLSQAKFCRQEGISTSSFHKWQKKLSGDPQEEKFVNLPAVVSESRTYRLEVEFSDGVILRIR